MKTRCKILVVEGNSVHNISLIYNTLNDIALAFDEICILYDRSSIADSPGNLARDWAMDKGQASVMVQGMDVFDWIIPNLVLSFGIGSGTVSRAEELGLWVREVEDKSDA